MQCAQQVEHKEGVYRQAVARLGGKAGYTGNDGKVSDKPYSTAFQTVFQIRCESMFDQHPVFVLGFV